ncbi:hypothetical protein AAFF_G00204560, partial [Aldrovandia affinis]
MTLLRPTDLDVLEVQQQLNETELDIATDTNTAMDIAQPWKPRWILQHLCRPWIVQQAGTPAGRGGVCETPADLVEPSEMQDG